MFFFYVSFRVTNHSCWPWRPHWLIQQEWRVLPGNNYFPVFLTYSWRLQFVCGKMCKLFPLPVRWLIRRKFSSHSRSYVTSEDLLMKPTYVKTKAVEPPNSPNYWKVPISSGDWRPSRQPKVTNSTFAGMSRFILGTYGTILIELSKTQDWPRRWTETL